MANKKIQKRNKKRKQEQMRSASVDATEEATRKKVDWRKVIGVALVVVLALSAFAAKFLHDRNLATTGTETTTEATAAPSSDQ